MDEWDDNHIMDLHVSQEDINMLFHHAPLNTYSLRYKIKVTCGHKLQ